METDVVLIVPRGTLGDHGMAKIKSCLASEQQELEALIAWADLKGIPLVHHANERHCSGREGARLKRSGVRRGYPDLSLSVARGGYFGLFIELKRNIAYAKSKMASPTWQAQVEWLTRLSGEHYYAVMCFGQDYARKIIEMYMKWPKTTFFGVNHPSINGGACKETERPG